VENLEDPAQYIPALLARCKKEYIQRTYGVQEWTDPVDFLEKVAAKTGKLLKVWSGGGGWSACVGYDLRRWCFVL